MIIQKDGIKGKNGNEYTAEVVYAYNKVEVMVYLKTANQSILVDKQFYLGEPKKDSVIEMIKRAVQFYEKRAETYPTLDDWSGEVYPALSQPSKEEKSPSLTVSLEKKEDW